MKIEDMALLKAFAFGFAMPLVTIPLTKLVPEWLAWGGAATLCAALFHWLPPAFIVGSRRCGPRSSALALESLLH